MIIKLSEKLLLAVKMENPLEDLIEKLASISLDELTSELNNDGQKKAFWINIYNAYYLILRLHRKLEKPFIYSSKEITIAQNKFSLDDIEHGILRRYRSKYSLGYLPKLFVSRLIKSLTVSVLDYRIHFALNCGAKSCPPIAFYKVGALESQLEMATQSFVEGETDIDDEQKLIATTSLFNWYKADFGGASGVRTIISKVFDRDLSTYKLSYKKYDWSDDLNNFS